MEPELIVNSCVVAAELIVAGVIYLEVRHGRSVSFLEKATNFNANEDRREIYNAFLKVDGDLEIRAKAFCDMILRAEDRRLVAECERQIALFNELGFSCRKPFWSWRGYGDDKLVSLLPHATIYVWLILKPYILKRREDTGSWYATPLLRFALRSVDYVLRYKRGLHLGMENGAGSIEITVAQLKAIRKDLRILLR